MRCAGWCRPAAVGTTRRHIAAHDQRVRRDVALRDAIEQVVLAFPGYGYRRVTCALQRAGWAVNHKRVLRVMRQDALLCQLQRHFVVPATTDSRHGYRTYPNLLAPNLLAPNLLAPNLLAPNLLAPNLLAPTPLDRRDQAWVADITYIHLPTCVVYLACLLDAYSRRVVGWQLSRWIDTQLTLAALERALASRQPQPGWIHHADRGVQYANSAYIARLEQAGAQISMAAKGNPYDNAKAESFFKTLKQEEVYLNEYTTFAEAEANLAHFIDDVYNAKRLHSSLGYRAPLEFEALQGFELQPTAQLPSRVVR